MDRREAITRLTYPVLFEKDAQGHGSNKHAGWAARGGTDYKPLGGLSGHQADLPPVAGGVKISVRKGLPMGGGNHYVDILHPSGHSDSLGVRDSEDAAKDLAVRKHRELDMMYDENGKSRYAANKKKSRSGK